MGNPQLESPSKVRHHEEDSNKLPNRGSITERGNPEQSNHYYGDIFDLGYLLLTCALGNLELFDPSGFYSLENFKDLTRSSQRSRLKNTCCILHCEEELRKSHYEFSPTIRLRESGQKAPLLNNYQVKTPRSQRSSNGLNNSKATYPFTLLELLRRHNRFSEAFLDFLCCCLQINSTARRDIRTLLEHEFVSTTHTSLGPFLSLNELLSSERKFQDNHENEEHVVQVFEAIKIVLLNSDGKERFTAITNPNVLNNRNSREYRKISDLAYELGVSIESLINRFRTSN